MRGKEEEGELSARKDRITPAYAGKSAFAQCAAGGARDHPRVCGEKAAAPFWALATLGSPPRMRGKETRRSEHRRSIGITPAYAGKRC